MKNFLILLSVLMMLTVHVQAEELPQDLEQALPDGTQALLEDVDLSGEDGLTGGIQRILDRISESAGEILRQRIRGAASVLLVVVRAHDLMRRSALASSRCINEKDCPAHDEQDSPSR